jgi:dTDP-4-dehydrorhamnose 3,5-epimerase
MISGVVVKNLETHADSRGYFREIIRQTDEFFSPGFGQFSHSFVKQGFIKAWHGHKIQTQWNYVVSGAIQVALYDNRRVSKTFGEIMEFQCGNTLPAQVYMFPPGVFHGYKCIEGPMNIIYITSGTYDIDDEERMPSDSVNYNWIGQ